MTGEKRTIAAEALIALHNELVQELNADREKLNGIKIARGEEAVEDDPTFNYALGRVVGFEMVVSGLHAFIVTERADQEGLLDLTPYEQE